MATHVIGIGGIKVSRDRSDVLVTYSLGSCLGVTVFDPVAGVGGLIHCLLPLSTTDPAKAAENPVLFTDSGTILLLEKLFELGADKSRLVVKLVGASNVMDESGYFRIGERNHQVASKILLKNSIPVAAESVGGTVPRTLRFHMDSGKTWVRSGNQEEEL